MEKWKLVTPDDIKIALKDIGVQKETAAASQGSKT